MDTRAQTRTKHAGAMCGVWSLRGLAARDHTNQPPRNLYPAPHTQRATSRRSRRPPPRPPSHREFFIDNLLVRVHLIIVMIRWTGLAPWEFEFPCPGSLTSTFLAQRATTRRRARSRRPPPQPPPRPRPQRIAYDMEIRSPPILDHIPLYSPVYGGVDGKRRVT